MTLMDALMPTHAELAQAAVSEPVAPAAPERNPLRKYVILKDSEGEEVVLLFSPKIQHSHVVSARLLGRYSLVAAGFVIFRNGKALIPQIGSESLHLAPRPQDKQLLEAFITSL